MSNFTGQILMIQFLSLTHSERKLLTFAKFGMNLESRNFNSDTVVNHLD